VSRAALVIGGEVAAPQSLEFETLRALAEQLVESSTLLAGREIAAVRLDTLLTMAGVTDGACSVVAESSEGSFIVSMSLEAARSCVVVYRVGEAPLPHGLGGPFRLVTNGRLRCGDVKGLRTIYVSRRAHVESSDTERVCVRTAHVG
jgi:DMSO/TMAO reductase YedYZ molybdopterin-dependent catalytic subunit